jgi:hypothetical protein
MHGRLFRLTQNYGAMHERWEGYDKGKTVKAVMVSRLGDVGVTLNLKAENGYDLRVLPWMLEPIERRPEGICALCNLDLAAGCHEGGHLGRKCDECNGETGPCDPVCPSCCFKKASTL